MSFARITDGHLGHAVTSRPVTPGPTRRSASGYMIDSVALSSGVPKRTLAEPPFGRAGLSIGLGGGATPGWVIGARRRGSVRRMHPVAGGSATEAFEPVLRMIAGATSTANLFSAAFSAISVVFLVRQIGLGASTIGILSSSAAIGGVVGAFSATWLRRRAGSARIIWVSMTVFAPCALLIPLTSPGPGLLCYAAGLFMTSFGIIVYNVNHASFRQLLCPPRLLGRMNATMRFIVWGTLPLGGLLGGTLGTWLGNRNALWAAAASTALSPIWLLASPLRRMRDIPPAGTEPARLTGTGQPAVP